MPQSAKSGSTNFKSTDGRNGVVHKQTKSKSTESSSEDIADSDASAGEDEDDDEFQTYLSGKRFILSVSDFKEDSMLVHRQREGKSQIQS